MANRNIHKGNTKKNLVWNGVLLVCPFLFIGLMAVASSFWGWHVAQEKYPLFSVLVYPKQAAVPPEEPDPVVSVPAESGDDKDDPPPEEYFVPHVYLDDQWAVMHVDGWEKDAVKVYYGCSKTALKKGAGTWGGSRLCGQDGKLVLCAHVTTWFYELETTPVGTRITLETDYGTYVYQVRETLVFEKSDNTILANTDGEETLVLYTCYPRSVGYRYTAQRMALICDKIEGKTWVKRG
ncbi:MAG: sortase [Clostridia bacterium]|nr:sortase [Clostridia bacterium]